MHQGLIASKSFINKGKKSVDLLIEYLLPSPDKSLQPQTGEPKPRVWLCKNPIEKHLTIKINKRALADNIAIKEDIEKDMA